MRNFWRTPRLLIWPTSWRTYILGALAMLLATTAASGCRRYAEFNPSISGRSELAVDQFVRASPLAMYGHPDTSVNGPAPDEPKILFVPFRIDQVVAENRDLARNLTRAFWMCWNSSGVFGVTHFEESAYNYGDIESAALGRQIGADMVVTGIVPYLYAGGTVGDSALTLRLKVLDARTARVIWSFEETGQMQADMMEDYIGFIRRVRLPSSPMHAIVEKLAKDMAVPIDVWTGRTPWEKVDEAYLQFTPHPTPPEVAAKQRYMEAQKALRHEVKVREALTKYDLNNLKLGPTAEDLAEEPDRIPTSAELDPDPVEEQPAARAQQDAVDYLDNAQPAPQPAAQPAAQADGQPVAQPATQPMAKPAATPKGAPQTAPLPVSQAEPTEKPEPQATAQAKEQPATAQQADTQTATEPAQESVAEEPAAIQPAAEPGAEPAAPSAQKQDAKPVAKLDVQPSS